MYFSPTRRENQMSVKKKSLEGWLVWESHIGLGLLDKKPDLKVGWCENKRLMHWINDNFGFGVRKVRITLEEIE
jgi:hypothetical protein